MEGGREYAVRRPDRADVAEEVRVIAVDEVAADMAPTCLLTHGGDLGEELAQVQQVGGLPRLGAAFVAIGLRSQRRQGRSGALSSVEAERTTPEPLVIARWMALRWTERSSTASRIRPSPMPEPSGPSDCGAAAVAVTDGNSPWAKRSAMSSAIRWANTRPSRSELDARRLAP